MIAGASLAGLRAAEAARREGYDGRITLVGAEPHLPYDRPPLSKTFLTENAEARFFTTGERLSQELEVELLLGRRAMALDPATRQVQTDAGSVCYDRLVIATGSEPRALPGVRPGKGIWALRTLDDSAGLRRALKAAGEVVVVGAGFIGAEIASAARSLGAAVTLVEAATVPLVRAVGAPVGQALARLHERNGTRLICGVQVERIAGDERGYTVALSNGERVDADIVVVGIGAVPATRWLRGAGIALDPRDGGVVCDEYLRTSVPDVYAAGDVARWPNALFDEEMRLENWTNAADQGQRAAVNALFSERARRHETVPYFWSDWYDHRIQFAGTPVADEVTFASGAPDQDRFVALYRRGARLVGVATLNEPRKIMKYRRHIGGRGGWAEAARAVAARVEAPVIS